MRENFFLNKVDCEKMLVNLVPVIYTLHTCMYSNEGGDGLKVRLLMEELDRGSKMVDRAMD